MVSIGDTYPIDTTVSVSVSDTVSDTVSVNKDVDINKKTVSETAKASKHKYGEYQHVLLKDEELQALQRDYTNWEELIKYLDEYIEMKGYKAKSHYLCIRKWVVNAVKEQEKRSKTNMLAGGVASEDPWEVARLQLEKDGVLDDV